MEEKLRLVEAELLAFKDLIREQRRLLKEGSKAEATELDKAIKNACLRLLEAIAEAEVALLEEEEEQSYPLLE